MIKGGREDDSVLCTSDKAYNIRSVALSKPKLRSLGPRDLVSPSLSPSPHIDGSEKQLAIQDSLHELLELMPAVPKVIG